MSEPPKSPPSDAAPIVRKVRTLSNRPKIERDRAVAALLAGQSVPAVAKLIGVTRRTISDWMRLPDVMKSLEEGRAALVAASRRTLVSAAARASAVLTELLEAEDEKTRLGAARAILGYAGATEPRATPVAAPAVMIDARRIVNTSGPGALEADEPLGLLPAGFRL